jgi:uncharacterized protein YbcC (UPF0753/DUF2309 family)
MPGREHGFLAATRMLLASEGRGSLPREAKSLTARLEAQASEGVDSLGTALACMEALGVPPPHWNDFVAHEMLALRGWASLFAHLERFAEEPETSPAPKYRLVDLLAVQLTVTLSAVEGIAPNPKTWQLVRGREDVAARTRLATVAEIFDGARIVGLSASDVRSLTDEEFERLWTEIAAFGEIDRRRVLHHAYEHSRERRMLAVLPLATPVAANDAIEDVARIVFCADDKQSLLRLRLEECQPGLRTCGVTSFPGPTIKERVDSVARLIRLVGIHADAPCLIVLVGHAKKPENRPSDWSGHCGVCEGKCGVEYAQRLAEWANDAAVRDELRSRGIDISIDTWFLAASDSPSEFETLDRGRVPECLTVGCGRSRRRGARLRAGAVRPDLSGLGRQRFAGRILARVGSMFVKSPDVGAVSSNVAGHPGCALCLIGFAVGAIALSHRGAFTASYNAAADPDGSVLASILEELVPACAKVNLDYFFARIDNDQYGVSPRYATESGDLKDPDGDLRPGFPGQPLRATNRSVSWS